MSTACSPRASSGTSTRSISGGSSWARCSPSGSFRSSRARRSPRSAMTARRTTSSGAIGRAGIRGDGHGHRQRATTAEDEDTSRVYCGAGSKRRQHAQRAACLWNQGKCVVQRGRDVRDRASDAYAHHDQPELHRGADTCRHPVREHHGQGRRGAAERGLSVECETSCAISESGQGPGSGEIWCPVDEADAEELLKAAIREELNRLTADQLVMLKLTLPEKDDLYAEFVKHPRVVRVVALSGGYTRDEGNRRLRRNHGVVASFSRALVEG